ncbi:hypothetical protein [Paenisporosarcina sp. HGH0030]|uniref:hypothetical protein n=1 Tax=Paenisporosarcina sp. HGH0030 TaxID=1078085 RepID=UPI0011C81EE6|nr:hypothetical protein [Paenisporosarcina sp. HGH0030]
MEGWNIEDTDQVEPMSLVQGDGSPFSYLQGAMLYRDIDEFGRFWHSTQWGVEECWINILPWKKGLSLTKMKNLKRTDGHSQERNL